MPSLTISSPIARAAAIATLMGSTFLAGPLTPAMAGPAANAPLQLAQNAPATPPAAAGETIEQRITNLHAALKITPDEESKWNAVAQAMRENAAAMDKLAASKLTKPPQNLSAVDDLKTYQEFAQAHVDGLKNLIPAFNTLYQAMPDPQKKNADQVFQNFGKTPAKG